MTRRSFASLVSALPTVSAVARAQSGSTSLTDSYREAAAKLIGAALVDEGGWSKLAYLCDRIGNRLSGSDSLNRAIEWAQRQMKADGLANVQALPAKVPHWVRGTESATMLEPLEVPLPMLGLGGSVATPAEGITADVVVVHTFDELTALGADKVKGKVVLYNQPWQGYGRSVAYRAAGASRAAALGAVAALVRSVTPVSIRSPHTGMMVYDEALPKIPTASITVEDAERIDRLTASGQRVRVQLKMSAKTLPDADSANVIGEIRGREKPEELVVLGGHYDSWDVGQGAQDDGSGCVACWQAVVLMKQLNLIPRRTVRVVLWTNEENGTRGGQAYAQWAADTVKNHVAAIEMDGGAERPVGFGLSVRNGQAGAQQKALARAKEIGALLAGLDASEMTAGGGGADIGPLMALGVPGFGHQTVGKRYFEWHHTHADTLDKIDPQEFRMNIAVLAVLAYVLADMPERIDQA